jgi:hypothetical protein
MSMTTSNLSYILDEVVSAVAYESFYEDQFMMPSLYDVRTSKRRRERMTVLGGLTTYDEKTAGAEPTTDQMRQEAQKDWVHVAYGKKIPIERELVEDQEWGLLGEVGIQLGTLAAQTMEVNGAALFNDAFAGSTYTDAYGLSICNDAHLNAAGGNSQDNSGTNSLNYSGLNTTRTAMRKFTNAEGDKLSVRPDLLLVPTDLEMDAWELLKSALKPGTTNNNANFYAGAGFSLGVVDHFTDTNAWFMCDSRLMRQNLIWWQRVSLEVYGDGNLHTGTRNIGGYFRCSHGSKGWRWIYGNNPS